MKIIAADDELVSLLMLQGAIEALGHECLTAQDGEQAWKLLTETGADVVITDSMMPAMDGLELCRRIRAHAGGSYTYVIVASSLADREDVIKGMEAGADDYLTKPVDPSDLQARLIAAERVTMLHAELALSRKDLARLARTDPLTQLRNRLSLNQDLAELQARSTRYSRSYCLVMCDVDFFKAYNTVYDHQAGDLALQAVAGVLAAQGRQNDSVYRYGGEEFLLVLPEQDSASGAAVAERARRGVESLRIEHRGGGSAGVVTISVGVASFGPGDNTSSDNVLKEADAALYRAKSDGRNRVGRSGLGPAPVLSP